MPIGLHEGQRKEIGKLHRPEFDDGNTLYVTFSRSHYMGWFGSEFVLEKVTLP